MNEKEIIKGAVESITREPDLITVAVKPKNRLHRLLIQKGWLSSEKRYEVTPLLAGNRLRISKAIASLPDSLTASEGQSIYKAMQGVLSNHLDTLLYVVAVILHNKKEEPSPEFIKRIAWDLSEDEMLLIALMALKRSRVEDFINTTILIKGLDVVSQHKMGPSVPGELSEE